MPGITQQRPPGVLSGRLYGAFTAKSGTSSAHPVGVLTQQRPAGVLAGRRYGSFAGKTVDGSSAHPVEVLTQQRPPGLFGGARYGSFAGKEADAGGVRQLVHDFPIPLAWYADPGFSAAYQFQPLGVAQNNRADRVPPQRVVRLFLTSDFSAAYPASTAWHYALHASADPALWGAPLMQGDDGAIDSAGDFLLNVNATALAAGDMPGLVVTDGTTDPDAPIIAFVGPVLVTEE